MLTTAKHNQQGSRRLGALFYDGLIVIALEMTAAGVVIAISMLSWRLVFLIQHHIWMSVTTLHATLFGVLPIHFISRRFGYTSLSSFGPKLVRH